MEGRACLILQRRRLARHNWENKHMHVYPLRLYAKTKLFITFLGEQGWMRWAELWVKLRKEADCRQIVEANT